MNNPIIGFCGLTHLGICSAIASISKNFQTICYDENIETISALNKGHLIITEPLIEDALKKKKHLIEFTNNIKKIEICDLIYVSIDIETESNGTSDLNPIHKLMDKILSDINDNKILIVLSQVPPGFTREYSKIKHLLFYQVETLIFGKAYERAMYPERVIVGSAEPKIDLPEVYLSFLKAFNCPILNMKYESAELTKISINLFLLSSLSTANKMAEICENINADWHEIIPALKLDKRIGSHAYISPGLGVAGGNLERDLTTIRLLSKNKAIDYDLFSAFNKINTSRKSWVWKQLTKILQENVNPRIAILGLTYKENTHSLKNAPSLELLPMLEKHNVIVYDPVVEVKDRFIWCKHAKSIFEAIKNADILIIMTPWKEFKNLSLEMISKEMKGNVIIDPFNVFDRLEISKNKLISFVIGSQTDEI